MTKREKHVWASLESELNKTFDSSTAESVLRTAKNQHAQWMIMTKETSRSRLKMIREGILPRVAVYGALKERGLLADEFMDRYVREVAGPMMHGMYAKAEKIPGFWTLFTGVFKRVTDKSDYWICESRKDGDRFYLDIHKCLWHDTCSEVGYPECCRFFCECDNYTYGGLKKIGFSRTQTLGTGGEKCDFVMYRKRR